ncbi:MAG: sulfatase-like hydrolase/transferase [Myxococcota bacterium]
MREFAAVLSLCVLGAGCGSPTRGEPATSPAAPSAAAERGETPPDPPAPRPVRVHYALAAHPERAELREGRTLVVDLGRPSGAKYTLGGWRTDVVAARWEDRPVGLVTGHRGNLHLPFHGDGNAVLTLRARALRRGRVVVRVNGEALETVTWPTDGFDVLRFEVPESVLVQGDNRLDIRARRMGRAPDGTTASVALDWVRIGPAAEGHRQGEPSAPEEHLPRANGEVPTAKLPAGGSLAWTFEVPSEARLRGVARGAGAVAGRVHTDGAEPRVLGPTRDGSFDWDLAPFAGRVVRLELEARQGDVRLFRPSVVTPAPADTEAARPRPEHVLVYLVDTLRADKLRPYNADTRVKTPGLAKFAETAATFLDARSQDNWTKPSVATLLSSLMPWEHTATKGNSKVPASVDLLPEMLGEHGFHTGAFIANGYVSNKFGFGQGWDTYRNYIREHRRTDAEFVAADALDWLDQRPEDEPFFLYVHTIDPHVPYRPPDEFLEPYGNPRYRGPVNFGRDATLLGNIKTGKVRLRKRDKAHLEALYDGEISYHDVHFAAILDGLERRGLADDTLVVVTSDHGEEFWDHGSVGHGHSVYDELLRVPLLIRMPGMAEGQALRADAGLVDVVPTLLDALGLPVPEHLAGRSLLPELSGEPPPAPAGTVSGFLDNWRALAVGRTKLVQRGAHDARLYDLHDDPDENRNVAADRPVALRHARALLGLRLADAEPVRRAGRRKAAPRKDTSHREQTVEIDDETAAQLRALGYVD